MFRETPAECRYPYVPPYLQSLGFMRGATQQGQQHELYKLRLQTVSKILQFPENHLQIHNTVNLIRRGKGSMLIFRVPKAKTRNKNPTPPGKTRTQ